MKAFIIITSIIVSLIIIDISCTNSEDYRGKLIVSTGDVSAIVYLRNNDESGEKKIVFETDENGGFQSNLKNKIFAKGTTPYNAAIGTGSWDLVVKAKGYKDFKETIKVRDKEELTFNITLEKEDSEKVKKTSAELPLQ